MPVTAVNVLNNNSFPLEDGFNGVLYTFAPGKAITIPVEAAKHILGWDERAPGSISFSHVEQRWGWNTKATARFAQEWALRRPRKREPRPAFHLRRTKPQRRIQGRLRGQRQAEHLAKLAGSSPTPSDMSRPQRERQLHLIEALA